ncbi:S-formylglutathione hydrolase [Pelagibius marinus]|uniref:S-formylglutathione hydrolase n=1 Tax=Pelagibius marinus TaxID=2762760 RepID=UPI001872935A|nr:S-formylglutathione hydrolase [Pelagibius marinus]
MDLIVNSQQRCFEGTQGFYSHESEACGGTMNFAVFQPPQAKGGNKVPLVTYLSGLTCTEANFTEKAGAQRVAAELGVMVLAPDTSPRGAGYPGEDDDYDFGTGAGFYLDATVKPWSGRYRMYSYITKELPALIAEHFPADMGHQGIMGHSMGGHGALTIHLKNPGTYKSVSAFAPIVAPSQCPWGQKALTGYLGKDETAWQDYDACALIRRQPSDALLFIDQGVEDPFLSEQLLPDLLVEACEDAGQHFELRMQPDYDHSYYFIQSFMEDHLRHHAKILCG